MKGQLLLSQFSFCGSLSLINNNNDKVEKSASIVNYEKYGIYKDFLKEKKSSSASLFISLQNENINISQKEEIERKLLLVIDQEYQEIKKSYSLVTSTSENSQNQMFWDSIQIYHTYIMVRY
jgi:hypothetical protein